MWTSLCGGPQPAAAGPADYPDSDSDDNDITDEVNDSPSWSCSGGRREGSFKKKTPATPFSTPAQGRAHPSFLSPSALSRGLSVLEVAPAAQLPGALKVVEGETRKTRVSELAQISERK